MYVFNTSNANKKINNKEITKQQNFLSYLFIKFAHFN